MSIAHEGDTRERSSILWQGAQARSAYDRVEFGPGVPVGAHNYQQRTTCHGKTSSVFAQQTSPV